MEAEEVRALVEEARNRVERFGNDPLHIQRSVSDKARLLTGTVTELADTLDALLEERERHVKWLRETIETCEAGANNRKLEPPARATAAVVADKMKDHLAALSSSGDAPEDAQ